jgi:hypothetical protein
MPGKPRTGGGDGNTGKPGDGTSGDRRPSQTHGNIDASKSVSSAHEAISQAAHAGRPGSGDQTTSTNPTTTPSTSSIHTQPSGTPDPNAVPGGTPANTAIGTALQREGHRIENDSATILARAGYKINQNTGAKGKNGLSEPDYEIEGKLWDHYAPRTDNEGSIRTELRDKVKTQTGTIVINMERSPMTVEQMQAIFPKVNGLEQVKIIDKAGNIIDAYPR